MASIRNERRVFEDGMPPKRLALFVSSSRRFIDEHHSKVVAATGLFPLLFVIAMVIGKIATPNLYWSVVTEDSVVEYATFLVYLIASSVAATLAIKLRHERAGLYLASYAFLAAGLFTIGMEEISWGQRIFNIETPSTLQEYNYKRELNIHNIDGFPLHYAFIFVGFYGAFSRLVVPGSIKRRDRISVDLFTPPYRLCLYFFIPAALYLYFQFMYHQYLVPLGLDWTDFNSRTYDATFVVANDQEPVELLLALGFLLFVVINRYRYAGRARTSTAIVGT